MWFTLAALFVTPFLVAAYQHPQGCSQLASGPVALDQVPEYFPPQQNADVRALLDTESIRQTLAFYALAIDGRDFNSLPNVFTADAIANYSAPLGVLKGRDAIKTALAAALGTFTGTQHLLGTQVIDICGVGANAAVSVTYYRAAHFLPRNTSGEAVEVVDDSNVLYAYGQYQDTWKKEKGTWKIAYRNLVYMVWKPLDHFS